MDRRIASSAKLLSNVRPFHKLLILFIVALLPCSSFANDNGAILLVVFKQGKTSVTSAFEEIIKGIEKQPQMRVIEKIIDSKLSDDELRSLVKENNASAIVLLGSKTVELFEDAHLDIPVLTGATLHPLPLKNSNFGISLTADPGLMFQQIKTLTPNISKIHVVFDPVKNRWLIDMAKQQASALDLELISHEADNLRASAKNHRDIVEGLNSKTDAIWLLQDSNLVGDSDVLPYLLKEAWQNNVVIISSNPMHVQRGALLSLYSERELTGEELGELAKSVLLDKDKPDVNFSPSKKVKSTINIRTAGHIGIRLSAEQLNKFDLIFPKK